MRTEDWIAEAAEALAGEARAGPPTQQREPRQNKRAHSAIDTHAGGGAQPEASSHPKPARPAPRAKSKRGQSGCENHLRRAALPQAAFAPLPPHEAPAAFSSLGRIISDPPSTDAEQPQASVPSNTIHRAPAATSLGGQQSSAVLAIRAAQTPSDEGHPAGGHHDRISLVGTITEQHRRRWDMIRARQRLELQAQAVCRRLCRGDKAEAAKLWAAVQKDEGHELRPLLSPYLAAMQPLFAAQADMEKSLAKLVRDVPVYEWAKGIKGLGDISLSAIVGECAAPVGSYKSVSAVWKRMGLAVINGERQRRIAGEAAIEHGYNAQRRSIMWNIGASLIKAQVRKDPDDPEKRVAIGDYGALYLERKAFEAERVDSKAHAHNRAQRYIEKRLLRELWRAWRNEQPANLARGD